LAFLGLPLWFLLPCLFLLGAIIGSFLNVCVYRLPDHEGVFRSWRGLWSPASHCPRCLAQILRQDNIPVVGWLKLRGRCRSCQARIPIRYPLVELCNGLLFVVVYLAEVLGLSGGLLHEAGPESIPDSQWFASASAVLNWRFAYHMVLLEALLVASLIDFDLKMIPDSVTVPAMLVGVAGGALGCVSIVPLWFQDPESVGQLLDRLAGPDATGPGWLEIFRNMAAAPSWRNEWPHLHGVAVSLAGLVVGGGVIWAVRLISQRILRQEAMGFGDVTLMAAIGSFLGWQPVLIVFFLAPIPAVVAGLISWFQRREREVPYGPYLSLATLLLLLFWKPLWGIAEPIFGWGPFFAVLALVGGALFVPLLLLTRTVRRLLGIPDPRLPVAGTEWSSADQLAYFAGETVDRYQGRWRTGPDRSWQGTAAGRGQAHESSWRHGD